MPKGKILIIGGHEEKGIKGENIVLLKRERVETHFKILTELFKKVPVRDHVIEIIAAASEIAKEMEALYIKAFKNAGFSDARCMLLENKRRANSPDILERIRTAHAVFFTGGSQKKLSALLSGSKLLRVIRSKYRQDSDFFVAGSSAGAMALPELMILGGTVESAILKGDIEIGRGLGFIKGIIVDTHFINRGRFTRLAHAITMKPNNIGIGLSEDTALVISDGNKMECIGSGMVIIIDGTRIKATNISKADYFTPIVVENLKIDIMAAGSRYILKKRKFIMGRRPKK